LFACALCLLFLRTASLPSTNESDRKKIQFIHSFIQAAKLIEFAKVFQTKKNSENEKDPVHKRKKEGLGTR